MQSDINFGDIKEDYKKQKNNSDKADKNTKSELLVGASLRANVTAKKKYYEWLFYDFFYNIFNSLFALFCFSIKSVFAEKNLPNKFQWALLFSCVFIFIYLKNLMSPILVDFIKLNENFSQLFLLDELNPEIDDEQLKNQIDKTPNFEKIQSKTLLLRYFSGISALYLLMESNQINIAGFLLFIMQYSPVFISFTKWLSYYFSGSSNEIEQFKRKINSILKKLGTTDQVSQVSYLGSFYGGFLAVNSGSFDKWLKSPYLIKIPLKNISYGKLTGMHFKFILTCFLKKHSPALKIVASDDQGCLMVFFESIKDQSTDVNSKVLLTELEKINNLNQRIYKKIKKCNRFCKISVQPIYEEVDDIHNFYQIEVRYYSNDQTSHSKIMSTSEFLENFVVDKNLKGGDNKQEKKENSNGYQELFSDILSNQIPSWWFFTGYEKPKIKTRGISYPKKLNDTQKKEPDFQIELNGFRYDCDDNKEIKLLYLNGKPVAIGIFRVTKSMFKDESFKEFRDFFINNNQLGGIHGNCFKQITKKIKKDVEAKVGDVPVPYVLHRNSNVRVLGLSVCVVKIKHCAYLNIKKLPIYDFCAVDESYHVQGKNDKISKSKASINSQSLEEYLKENCPYEKDNGTKSKNFKM